jgi:NADPH:quinone reductase-like Zn-dependent oxidoreductase
MKAIIFDRFGDPAEVLEIREIPVPEPGPGQVRVRMMATPINPSDLSFVRGKYGRLPKLPATPGFEGVGRVEAAGPGLLSWLRRGRCVAVLNGSGGNWQEHVVVPARQVVPVASALPVEQAATFFINPATAFILVHHVLTVPTGAWLLQTAAGSSLGRMIIRLGRRLGFRTINVVRRREQAEELLRLGADVVICSGEESIEERVKAATHGEGVLYALDAVGGTTASALVPALAYGGRLILYGTLSGEPMAFDPRSLMVKHLCIEGYWLSNWIREQHAVKMLRLFRRLGSLIADGTLTSPIASSFPLDQVREAVKQAQQPGQHGKILLRMN